MALFLVGLLGAGSYVAAGEPKYETIKPAKENGPVVCCRSIE
ncbi:hypothetical protein ACWC10_15855 [Streptomyces sp. NPDC001595]